MKPIFGRGPSLQFRLVLAIMISIGLMVADSRLESFAKFRTTYLDTFASPFFHVANLPSVLLNNTSENTVSRDQLQQENRALRQELLLKNSEVLLLRQLQQENGRLRELLGSPLRQDEYKMVTQVLSSDSDPYSDQLVIDKGLKDHVYVGQPVMNDKGVVGQVIAVAQNTSRVLLICDSSHALPVQVLRNDIRVIALGNGCLDDLLLEYLPLNADIEPGDELVTSGLGGNFPEGYPVAIVTSVRVDRRRAHTVIHAKPTVSMERLRYLLLVWTSEHRAEFPLKDVEPTNQQQSVTLTLPSSQGTAADLSENPLTNATKEVKDE
jgi:rod shape-determining protein MreC